MYEDETGSLWMLANSPVVGLVKYDPKADSLTTYPLGARDDGILASTSAGGSLNGTLLPDGPNGLWVPSSQGLYYFDRAAERFTYRFQHEREQPRQP